MIVLLRTYLDIIRLRAGPAVIPASGLVFVFSLALLGIAWIIQLALTEVPDGVVRPALLAYAAALAFYTGIVSLLGFRSRLLPMLSSIIACGSLLAVLSTISVVLIAPLAGATIARTVGVVVWLWSVPVKGHIVARTVNRHWFFGIAIAMLAFILRTSVESSMIASQQGAMQ